MFPQEPHSSVGDCAYNQTQTTENQSSQARVLGYYYVPSLSIEHGSLSRALPLQGQFVDTLVLQVFALITRQHVRQWKKDKQNTSMQPYWKDAGQRACTVPTSATKLLSVERLFLFYSTI